MLKLDTAELFSNHDALLFGKLLSQTSRSFLDVSVLTGDHVRNS